MSEQNQATLNLYEDCAQSYLDSNTERHARQPEKQAQKTAWHKDFVREGLSGLPQDAKLFEFGSGAGDGVILFSELGYQITPSDAPESFLQIMRTKGLDPLKFNILTDEFSDQYDGIYSWRVLVHFTKDDTVTAFRKVFQALKPGGRYIFNILNTEGHNNLSEEWIDFGGGYQIGEKRYFKYWNHADLTNLLQETGFVIKKLEIGGGDDDKRWFYVIVEKPEEE